MSFLDLDVGISREGGNINGTSVELVKIKLKRGPEKRALTAFDKIVEG